MTRLLAASALLALVALAGCGPHRPPDVVGPFTGVTYRFAVDQLTLPVQSSDFADDLNGDGRVDNELGYVAATLTLDRYVATAIDDMLGSGALAPVVEITTDDPLLRDDPTVGVRFIGLEGEEAGTMGGRLTGGTLLSNRTATTEVPVGATVHLPLFERSDPLPLPATGLEIDLAADDGGFSATLRGAFAPSDLQQPAWIAMAQMLASNPQEYPSLLSLMDTNRDGVLGFDEFTKNPLIVNATSPDIQLTDGMGQWDPSRTNSAKDSFSFAFTMHLVRCDSGTCHGPPADTCHDRVAENGESDVDCGGACAACPGGLHCNVAADCQSGQCNGGVCAAPSCSDGVRDGGETGVDCGYGCSNKCALGENCRSDFECDGGNCAGDLSFGGVGVCEATLCNDGVRDASETDVDCGGACPTKCGLNRICDSDSDCKSGHCIQNCKMFCSPGVCS